MRENTIQRALLINKLVTQHYEPGRQDRSAVHIYRTVVRKVYPMSERTFWRMMHIVKLYQAKQKNEPTTEQKTLF